MFPTREQLITLSSKFKEGDSTLPEQVFKYIVAHSDNSVGLPVQKTPWERGSYSDIIRTVIKRPVVSWHDFDGVRRNDGLDLILSFLREIRFFHLVREHVNIVQYFGYVDRVGLVLEYIDGPTLESTLIKSPLTDDRKLSWANQIVDALLHIHSFNVCHGDLSMSNVLIESSTETVKLIDFGRSTISKSDDALFPGSFMFSPPDVSASNDGILNDAYSFGVLLLYMELGRSPKDDNEQPSVSSVEQIDLPLFGSLVRLYLREYSSRPYITREHQSILTRKL